MTLLEKIAAEAHCGPSTVARVLSSGNKETRPTAQRRADQIRAIADRMGYRPSRAAKSHRSGRYDCLALMTMGDSFFSYLSADLLPGVEAEAARHNKHLILTHMSEEQFWDEAHLPKILRECASDGLIIYCFEKTPVRVQEMLDRHTIPAVWLNSQLDADCVYPDDRRGAADLTAYLAALGHRRIAYLGPPPGGHDSEGERLVGYLEAMGAAGLPPTVFHPQDCFSAGLSPTEADRMLAENAAHPGPATAWVINEIYRAAPLYVAALRRGLRVPEDLSLTVCTQSRENDLRVPFTLSSVPMAETAVVSVQMLMMKIGDPLVRLAPRQIAPALILGETTGRLAA